jgi:hypothetical protein
MTSTANTGRKDSLRLPTYLLSEVESFARDSAHANQLLKSSPAASEFAGFALKLPIPSRFFRHVAFSSDGCWLWTGAVTNGPIGYKHHRYSQIRIGKRRRTSAHRFAYLYTFGDIPVGKEIDHTCENKLCVNPNHLELVEHRENIIRMHERRKAVRP